MLADIEEPDYILDEDMLEDAALIDIFWIARPGLLVIEIFALPQQKADISCLFYIKPGRKVWPYPVVHPDAAYPVAVGDEPAVFCYYRRV